MPQDELINLAGINAFVDADGHSHPDWSRVGDKIAGLGDEMQVQAWWQAVIQWLDRLASELDSASIYRSPRSLLLTASPEDQAERVSRFIDRSCSCIKETLGEFPLIDQGFPVVALEFETHAQYYTYVSHYFADGEYGTTGGMCIPHGYPHIITTAGRRDWSGSIIAHELTHLAFADRELPRWLEEGICQVMEEIAAGTKHFVFNREMSQRHVRHWGAEGLQRFWTGESFYKPDDNQELSYNLAQALVRTLIGDYRGKFRQFVKSANWRDAGDAAAREHFSKGLAVFASQMLGAGDWTPRTIDDSSAKTQA